jgi:hypothetical protein
MASKTERGFATAVEAHIKQTALRILRNLVAHQIKDMFGSGNFFDASFNRHKNNVS